MNGKKARIVLVTASSLCHNPRGFKEALCLAQAGYAVTVLGAWLSPLLKRRDQHLIETIPFEFVPVIDLDSSGFINAFDRGSRRIITAFADLAHDLMARESLMQLRFDVRRLFTAALRLDADLYIAHTELALYAACQLLRRGYRTGVDMEDWYSEDLLPEARRHRPISLLRSLEREALLSCTFATCPSQAMSQALGDEYRSKPPSVLYNSFPWTDRQAIDGQQKDRCDPGVVSICWYSQTLGPGRGIEDLIVALPLLRGEFELHLRGHPAAGMEHWIRSRIPERWRERVFFHPLVTNDELLSRVAEHDIGFAGEMRDCRSRDLTVTNKILHYLLGGLAVVASDTQGQREVAEQAPNAVELYPAGDARSLAEALNRLIESPERLRRAKAAGLRAAELTFCWERQQSRLLDAVTTALFSAGRSAMAPTAIQA